MSKIKFVSWNVNGLRAAMQKGFKEYFDNVDADFFCIQETKMQKEQATFDMNGYFEYWNCADKKGYSGTLIYTKHKPINVIYGISIDNIEGLYNDEGRVITLEYDKFYLVTSYTPNSQDGLKRLDYRMTFEDNFRKYLNSLRTKKSVIVCGDLNVAHKEIDLKNPKTNTMNPGFTIEERNKMTELLDSGFVDSFRYMNPDKIKYSWWSYRFNARLNNVGWRIDYFLLSDDLKDYIINAEIDDEILGSDHCPVILELEL